MVHGSQHSQRHTASYSVWAYAASCWADQRPAITTSCYEREYMRSSDSIWIARRVLNVAMPKIGLDCPGIVTIVGELVAAGVAQHVGMRVDAEISSGGWPAAP
jgi:hypothetical protein